jgi:cellulose synthase/poly-beta-1,6-N-acetylglucosamine synthase-like glycosyltransferase
VTAAAFWAAVATIAWTYVGFPGVTLARAALRRRPLRPVEGALPSLSVIVAAHDEQAAIGAKLRSILACDYPTDRLEVVVASDGSTDGTVAEARAVGDGRVRVLDLPRLGKAGALNTAVEGAANEVLVFTDANSMFEPTALLALVAPLADPTVGGVAGDQRYRSGEARAGTSVGEQGYWSLDRMLKRAQSDGGSATSATGALYAIRRSLFATVPEGVTDDFFVSTGVVTRGRRLVFAGDAVAWEPVASSASTEYGRKVRVMTRGLRGVWLRRELLRPDRHGFYAVQLFSHKVLRRLVAVPLVLMAAVTPSLWRRGPLYRLAGLGQLTVYGLGLAGILTRNRPAGRRRVLALPAYFLLVNAAALHALSNLLRGRTIARWEPERQDVSSTPS